MNRRSGLSLLLFLVLLLVAGACSSTRKAAKVEEQATSKPSIVRGQKFEFTSQLAATYADWTDLYAPLSIDLEAPINFNISARATMVRGESIHLSMRMLGMELAVAHINNDSAWVVDKFHKYICSMPTSKLTRNGRFSLSDLQDLMLGRAFYPGKGTLTPTPQTKELFSVQNNGDTVVMYPRRIPSDIPWLFIANNKPEVESFQISLSETSAVHLFYSYFVKTEAGATASKIDALGQVKDIALKASLDWNFSKARWNEGSSKDWTPPKGYTQLDIATLIKAFKSR